MKWTVHTAGCLVAMSLSVGCSRQSTESQSWHPDTDKLDTQGSRTAASMRDLPGTVRDFYEALRNRQWDKTYDYRTMVFRRSVSRDLYLKSMERDGRIWQLLNYRIMTVDNYNSEKVRLVVEFTVGPAESKNVAVVWWKKEADGWRCEEAGPEGLNLGRRVIPDEE